MKNEPKSIWLQIADADATNDKSIDDFNDLFDGAITWSDHRINQSDLEYISKRDLLEWIDANMQHPVSKFSAVYNSAFLELLEYIHKHRD